MKLLYITQQFPFEKAEHFPSLEYQYLCQEFKQVLVVPMGLASTHREWQYSQPANMAALAKVFDSVAMQLGKKGSAFKTLLSNLAIPLIKELCSHLPKHGNLVATYWVQTKVIQVALTQFIRLEEYPIWYTYWCLPATTALAMLKPKFPNTNLVSRAHNYDLYGERYNMNTLPFQGYTIGRLDRLFPCSNYGSAYISHIFPNLQNKIKTRYLGIPDTGILAKPSADQILHLLSCSNLTPVKRVAMIANALASVSRPVHWTHLGDGPEMEKVKEACHNLRKNITTRFYGHILPNHVMSFYRDNPVDLFLNVSYWEGLPIAIIEALSSGVPCCVTKSQGNTEAVDTKCGFIINRDNPVQELSQLLNTLELSELHALRNSARQRYLNLFSADKNYSNFAKELCELAVEKM